MQSARGAVILFADADGATKFSDLTKLEDALTQMLKGMLEYIIFNFHFFFPKFCLVAAVLFV